MDDNQLDGGQNSGTGGATNTTTSEKSADQLPSLDAAKLQKSLDAIASKVSELDARYKGIQGERDKSTQQTRKEVGDLKRQFAEIEKLTSSGMGLDDAVMEFDFRETVRQLKDQLSTISVSPQVAGNNPQGAGRVAGSVDNFSVADAIAEVESYELSVNDPSFLALLRKNPDRQMVKDYILELKKPPKQPNPADVVQSPVRGGAQEKNASQLEADYQKELQGIMGSTRPGDERIRKLGELKAKYRGMGLSK